MFERVLYVCSNPFVSKRADNIQKIEFPKTWTNNTIKRKTLGHKYTRKLALNGIFYFVWGTPGPKTLREWCTVNINKPFDSAPFHSVKVLTTFLWLKRVLELIEYFEIWEGILRSASTVLLFTVGSTRYSPEPADWLQKYQGVSVPLKLRISSLCGSKLPSHMFLWPAPVPALHVAAAWAPKDATKTVTTAWKDEFSTRERSWQSLLKCRRPVP